MARGGLGGRAWALAHVRTFDSLRKHPNYRLYFVGQLVSQTGSWVQSAALSWLVLHLTQSALAVALVAVWQFGPYAIFGLAGGTLSDRWDSRTVLLWTQGALAGLAAALAALSLAHRITPAAVYALAAAQGLVMVVNNPSQQALLVRMVGRAELMNAISLNAGIVNATRIVGPAVAGLLLASAGPGACFGANAVSYAAVWAALRAMDPKKFFPLQRAERPSSFLGELREGLHYAWRTPQVLVPLALLSVVSTVGINFGVLLPVLAVQTLHARAQVYGLVTSVFGAGAALGALLAATVGKVNWTFLLASAGGFALAELAMAPQRTLGPAMAFLFLTGAGFTLYTASTSSMVQLGAPDHLQGRATGLYNYVFLGTGPLGGLLAGWLCQLGGTPLAFGVAGATSLAATLAACWVLAQRGWLHPARPAPRPASAPAPGSQGHSAAD